MACQLFGRVIAVSQEKKVASSDASKEPIRKRELYIDCTRYDPYTGERSQYENKPLLEFSGDKTLEVVNPKLDALQKDDIIRVDFDIQGRPFTDKATGKLRVFTGIRCFDVTVIRKANGQQVQHAQPAAQPVQEQAAPQTQSPFPPEDNDPKDPNKALPF